MPSQAEKSHEACADAVNPVDPVKVLQRPLLSIENEVKKGRGELKSEDNEEVAELESVVSDLLVVRNQGQASQGYHSYENAPSRS